MSLYLVCVNITWHSCPLYLVCVYNCITNINHAIIIITNCWNKQIWGLLAIIQPFYAIYDIFIYSIYSLKRTHQWKQLICSTWIKNKYTNNNKWTYINGKSYIWNSCSTAWGPQDDRRPEDGLGPVLIWYNINSLIIIQRFVSILLHKQPKPKPQPGPESKSKHKRKYKRVNATNYQQTNVICWLTLTERCVCHVDFREFDGNSWLECISRAPKVRYLHVSPMSRLCMCLCTCTRGPVSALVP